jgi:hypothetical protein
MVGYDALMKAAISVDLIPGDNIDGTIAKIGQATKKVNEFLKKTQEFAGTKKSLPKPTGIDKLVEKFGLVARVNKKTGKVIFDKESLGYVASGPTDLGGRWSSAYGPKGRVYDYKTQRTDSEALYDRMFTKKDKGIAAAERIGKFLDKVGAFRGVSTAPLGPIGAPGEGEQELAAEQNRIQSDLGFKSDKQEKLAKSTSKVTDSFKRVSGLANKSIGLGLSMLFVGMGVEKLFGGLVRSGAGLVGILDIISTMVEVLMLPIMLALLPVFLDLLKWVLGLSENSKLLIGAFVLLGFIVGTVLMLLGQFVLALIGIVVFVAGAIATVIGGIVALIGGALAAFFGPELIALIAVVITVISLLVLVSMVVSMIVGAFVGLLAYLGILDDVIAGFIDLIMGFIKWMVGGATGGIVQLASGGVVTSPTLALVGESGPEAVVPLGSGGFGGSTTNNLYITNTISNEVDMEYVTRRIDRYMRNQNTFGAYS